MGDRALVVFTDGSEVSPTVYLHWSGGRVPALIDELKTVMTGREGDVQYSAARFIGICHASIDGNLSLGRWNTEEAICEAVKGLDNVSGGDSATSITEYSHGDAGCVVVNVNDHSWKAYGGYLAKREVAA